MNKPKERLKACEFLQGPKPIAAAIYNNNIIQNNAQGNAADVIDLRHYEDEGEPDPDAIGGKIYSAGGKITNVAGSRRKAGRTIDGKIIDITPRQGNMGEAPQISKPSEPTPPKPHARRIRASGNGLSANQRGLNWQGD